MKDVGYYNGVYAPIDELSAPIMDRGFYFGDGVYEVAYAHNHVPFALDEHLDRLSRSLELMQITFHMTRDALKEVIQTAIDMVDSNEQLVYLQVTRGTYMREHAFPPPEITPNLMLYSYHHPLADGSKRYGLITAEDMRWQHCNIKSLNLVPSVLATQKAKEAGCAEAILYRDGMVTEGASSNVYIIQNGALRTAPLSNALLAGVTRKHVLELATALGIPVIEEAFSVADLFTADEVIFTSSTRHCLAASTIDGKPVGNRAPNIVQALQSAYHEKLLRETSR